MGVSTLEAMTDDIDIYRAAKLLADRHGDDAPIQAAMHADKLMDAGDMDGRGVWLQIKAAVEELLRIEVAGGGALTVAPITPRFTLSCPTSQRHDEASASPLL